MYTPAKLAVLLSFGITLSSAFLLDPRQSADDLNIDDIPDTCKTVCQDPVSELKKCDDSESVTCICNNDLLDHYTQCLSCLIKESGGAYSESEGQSVVDSLVNAYNEAGSNVDKQDINLGDDFTKADGSSSLIIGSTGTIVTAFLLSAGSLAL